MSTPPMEYRGHPGMDMGWVKIDPEYVDLFIERGNPVQQRPKHPWTDVAGPTGATNPAPSALAQLLVLIAALHEGRHSLTPAQMRAAIVKLHQDARRLADKERGQE